MRTPRSPCVRNCDSATREPLTHPMRLTSITRRKASIGMSSNRPTMRTAAQFTQTSIRPYAATAASRMRSTAAGSVRSAAHATASAPCSWHARTTTSNAPVSRPTRTRLARRAAKASAVAWPIPLDAPAMTIARVPGQRFTAAPLHADTVGDRSPYSRCGWFSWFGLGRPPRAW